jgi:hypothetical protein
MTTGGGAPGPRRDFLFFLFALAALSIVWLGRAAAGEVFVSTETVWRSVQPWSGTLPSPPPPHNENLADPPTIWLPMQAATRAMVREWLSGGEPPLWCAQSFCGAPWLGNMSSALFSPFTWLFVVLPFAPAFAVCAAAKWLLAGIGSWLLARRLGIGPAGRALAGLGFAFCGFQVVWIDSCLTNVSAWAPWLLLAIERALERPTAGRAVALALASWQVLVGGHPETSVYVALGAFVFAACRWAGAPRRTLESLGALLLGAALGGLLSVAQWWPFLEYAFASFGHELRERAGTLFRPVLAPGSVRGLLLIGASLLVAVPSLRYCARDAGAERGTRASSARFGLALLLVAAGGAGLREVGLRPGLLLFGLPDLHGRSLDGGSYLGPLTYQDVAAGAVGAVVLVLGLAGACVRGREPAARALSAVALAASARFLRIPLLSQALDLLPGFEASASTRALCVVALALLLLAAGALDCWPQRRTALVRASAGAVALLVGIHFPSEAFAKARREGGLERSGESVALLEAPGDLLARGPAGLGGTFRLRVPPDAEFVTFRVNDRELGRARPEPDAAKAGEALVEWRWVASQRVEDGLYHVVADATMKGGDSRRLAEGWIDATRPLVLGPRLLVPAAALALALLLLGLARLRPAPVLVVFLSGVELAFFGARYNDSTPVERLPGRSAPEPIPLLQEKRRELGPFRVFAARTHLHPNLQLLFADPPIEVLRGYDALEPVDYVHVLNWLYRDGAEVPWVEMDFSTLDFEGYPGEWLADLLNARYAMSEEAPPAGWSEAWRQTPAAPGRSPLRLHENPDALPRAFAVQRAVGLLDAHARREDFRRIALWDEPGEKSFPGEGRVASLELARGRIQVALESDAGTILVVSENFLSSGGASGWRATIDGEAAEVRRTHGSFLSVVVPTGGRHQIELVYRPRSVALGAAASGGGALLLLALLAASRIRRLRVAGAPSRG